MCDILSHAISPYTATTVSAIRSVLFYGLLRWISRNLLHLRLGGLCASGLALAHCLGSFATFCSACWWSRSDDAKTVGIARLGLIVEFVQPELVFLPLSF